ncbi:hypothetical protein M1N58_02005, partial [Dehalococcoidales bacterium]|nr:hypothetical protein [Dehalococcoidales bacterium]
LNEMLRKNGVGCIPPFVLWLWPFLDSIFSWGVGIKPLRKDRISAISIELRRYRGQCLELDDGSEIKAGDLVIELHLNNTWFAQRRANSSPKTFREFVSTFYADLKYLARQLAEGKISSEIKAIHGVTLLHTAAQYLGFTVLELPDSLWYRLYRFYLIGLMQTYYWQGAERLAARAKQLVLKEVWMSKSKLLLRYS